jgi:hypothetical protein
VKNILTILLIGVLAWQGYMKYQDKIKLANEQETTDSGEPIITSASKETESPFTCDGRTHCSEMKSCEEATYFLRNCPGVQMDGDNDGVPCERQWCQ